MCTYFDDFTEEDLQQFSEKLGDNVTLQDGEITIWSTDGTSLTLVKHNGDLYMVVEESEGMFFEDGDNIYYTDPIWWAKLNPDYLDRLIEDANNGVDLCYSEYC